jgi:hypothetical protein
VKPLCCLSLYAFSNSYTWVLLKNNILENWSNFGGFCPVTAHVAINNQRKIQREGGRERVLVTFTIHISIAKNMIHTLIGIVCSIKMKLRCSIVETYNRQCIGLSWSQYILVQIPNFFNEFGKIKFVSDQFRNLYLWKKVAVFFRLFGFKV